MCVANLQIDELPKIEVSGVPANARGFTLEQSKLIESLVTGLLDKARDERDCQETFQLYGPNMALQVMDEIRVCEEILEILPELHR